MVNQWSRVCFAVLGAMFLVTLTGATQGRGGPHTAAGRIQGTVLDDHNLPLARAKVEALPPVLGGVPPMAWTDAGGHFVIGHLAWGKYKVFAMKESAGYPDTTTGFYSGGFVTATLSSAAPNANLRLRLGPKAAVIRGSVTNALTRAPIRTANSKLVRVSSPHDWIMTSPPSKYRVLLPPSTAVNLDVSAPGYLPKHYEKLEFASGTETRLDIRLVPKEHASSKR